MKTMAFPSKTEKIMDAFNEIQLNRASSEQQQQRLLSSSAQTRRASFRKAQPDKTENITPEYVYTNMCSKLKVLPNSTLTRQLDTQKVNMKYQNITDMDSIALSIPMQSNTSVKRLNLKENMIASMGTQYLSHMLTVNSSLSELVLNGNKVGQTEDALKMLVSSVLSNHNITLLDLSSNHLNDRSAIQIARLIQLTKFVRHLNLSNNQISSEGGILISSALEHNKSIQKLNISWNHLRLGGADKLASSLRDNVTLRCLNLRMNGFGTPGAAMLGKALQVNRTLLEVDISENRISMEGAAYFGKCIADNSSLKIVRMGQNPIQTQGSLALIKFLQESMASVLEMLDLENVMVLDIFMQIAFEMKAVRPDFAVKVGKVVNSAKVDIDCNDNGMTDVNPLEIVIHFMESQRMRIVDLFKTWDKDNSKSLSRDEFKDGLKSINTPLTEAQLDELIEMLDQDGSGEIELSELMHAINVDYKAMRRKVAIAVKSDGGPFPKSIPLPTQQKNKQAAIFDGIEDILQTTNQDVHLSTNATSTSLLAPSDPYDYGFRIKPSDSTTRNDSDDGFEFDF